MLIRVPKGWEIPEREVSPEAAFLNRRKFLQSLIAAGLGTALSPLIACGKTADTRPARPDAVPQPAGIRRNPAFDTIDRPLTPEPVAAKYNNFYEFGGTKNIWKEAQALPTENWKVQVGGLVRNPRTYDLDTIRKKFPQEERVYRFRCVEAWAMAVPWTGFPMRLLIQDVEPLPAAKFVRFTSYYNPKITTGPLFTSAEYLPWPYTEGLRLDEMATDLAFFATGIYGHDLPKQHGAPIREVVPWKYGYKGAKSIVKIEFLDHQPPTYWNTLQPNEYDFEANVNPGKPHPRWSQAEERLLGSGPSFLWQTRPTMLYNGYQQYVSHLYKL